MDKTKDVEVEGHRYQIGRMTARDGSWVLMQILTKMLPSGLDASVADAPAGRPVMSEKDFHSIQDHCLAVIRRYEENPNGPEIALPIMARAGVFAVKDLEYNIVATLALTVHALTFNIFPFFSGDGIKSIMESAQGLPPFYSLH